MMKLSCKEVSPDTDCNFVAKGNSATDVASKMLSHIKSEHPEAMKGMSEAEMSMMLESKAHS